MPGGNLAVAVIGLGRVGFEAAKAIAGMDIPEDSKYRIGKLVLACHEMSRAETDEKIILGLKSKSMADCSVVSCLTGNLREKDFLPDIAINCTRASGGRQTENRREMGEDNLYLNREISQKIPKDCL